MDEIFLRRSNQEKLCAQLEAEIDAIKVMTKNIYNIYLILGVAALGGGSNGVLRPGGRAGISSAAERRETESSGALQKRGSYQSTPLQTTQL